MSTHKQVDINPALASFVLLGVSGLILALLLAGRPKVEVEEVEVTAELVEATPTEQTPAEPEVVGYHPDVVAQGQQLYVGSCSGCHGPNATGITGLGKNLVESEFMDGLTDEELVQFVIVGRDTFDPLNTTMIAMPARGGNPGLTDENILAIVAYLRTLAGAPIAEVADSADVADTSETTDTQEVTDTTDTSETTDTQEVTDTTDTAEVTDFEPAEFTPIVLFSSADGYAWSCSGCHGADGAGVDGITSTMLESELLAHGNETALFDYLSTPQAVGSTDAFIHPVDGGYPELSDAELMAVIDYAQRLVPVPFDAQFAFNFSCAGCHGLDGQGVEGLASPVMDSDDPDAIYALLTTVQPVVSAGEGFVHPVYVYGGYPVLSDEEIGAIIDYMLSLGE